MNGNSITQRVRLDPSSPPEKQEPIRKDGRHKGERSREAPREMRPVDPGEQHRS